MFYTEPIPFIVKNQEMINVNELKYYREQRTEQKHRQQALTHLLGFSGSALPLPNIYGTLWRIGKDEAFRTEGRGFESRSSRHIGTLGKSLTRSCLWRFGVKLRNSLRAVSGTLLSSSGLQE